MNRYRQEVTDLDQRHARLVRTATFLGSTILIVAALWSAGFPPGSWWQTTERWWSALHEPDTTDTTAARVRAPEQLGGSVAPSTQAPALNANSATVRRLHLVATAPGRNVQEGTAQLGTDLANPQTYAAGALLENGSTLKEIHADHVLLERDGLSTELYVSGAVNPPSTRQSNDALVRVPDRPAPQLLANASPPTYTQIIRAAPRFEHDLIVGFEIYPGTRMGEFARLGLQGGDLLIAIDRAQLTSVDALNAALKDLGEGRAMTATVIRAGSEISVPLDAAAVSDARLAVASTDTAAE